jgi:hypothetical protein
MAREREIFEISRDCARVRYAGALDSRVTKGLQQRPEWESTIKASVSDTVAIYRDTLMSEATRGRYKEATHCIITTKVIAIVRHGNNAPDPAHGVRVGTPSAVLNRHGVDRSVLGVSAEVVDRVAELAEATFGPRSWHC